MGDIVTFKTGDKRIGVVGYAPYSLDLCQVTWKGRKRHAIVRKSLLEVVTNAKGSTRRRT